MVSRECVCQPWQDEIVLKFIRLSSYLMETRMAEVIRLQERLAKQPRRASGSCEAKVLLFTGVRYERWDDTSGHPAKRSNSAKAKKH
jgi:hypothetical protein